MKTITALLLISALTITCNSFSMEPEETSNNQSIDFDKLEKRRLQEQNNKLLQENNKLLRMIFMQNYFSDQMKRPFAYHVDSREGIYYKKLDALYKEFEDNYKS